MSSELSGSICLIIPHHSFLIPHSSFLIPHSSFLIPKINNLFRKSTNISSIADWLQAPVSIAPLVTFRLVFGAVMVFSTLRFWYLGWIEEHFIDTRFTFKFFGFE